MNRLPEFMLSTWMLPLVLVIALPIVTANGNPSSTHPERQLAVHGTIPGARELTQKLYGVYQELEATALDLNRQKDNPSRFSYSKLENAFGDLIEARRDAKWLRLMGEPAGADLQNLNAILILEYNRLSQLYRSTTKGQAQAQKNLAEMKRQHPRNEKALDEIVVAIKNNQLESAEKQLATMERELHELAFVLSPSQASPYMKRTIAILSQLDTTLVPLRRRQYLGDAQKAAAKNLQDVSDFVAEAARVRTEIGAQGGVSVDGSENLMAPAAIRYLAVRWGRASAALTRNIAIEWAFAGENGNQSSERSMTQVSQLTSTAKEAIIAVIDAAAVSTPAEKIPSVYSEILKSLSYIDRRMTGTGISKDCQAALQRFAAKSPTLPASIAAYERAVSQPLRWRSRFSARHCEAVKSGYTNVASTVARKYEVTKFAMPEMYGANRPGTRELVTATFTTGAGWRVADASQFVVGTRVSDSKILRLYEGSLTAIGELSGRYYCNVAIGMPIDKAMDDLRISLVVNDDHPPLSIEAADAISSGESQDFLEFGGVVKQLHLEALVTRMATLPGRAHQLVPLGGLPSLHDNRAATEQSCWRFDIEPHWVRHTYFTVAIPGKLPR